MMKRSIRELHLPSLPALVREVSDDVGLEAVGATIARSVGTKWLPRCS